MAELGLAPLGDPSSVLAKVCALVWPESAYPRMYANNATPPIAFGGSVPMPFARRHLSMVRDNEYCVYEKSKGARYMVFVQGTRNFLISAGSQVFEVPTSRLAAFLLPDTVEEQWRGTPHEDTLADGDLVFNKATKRWELHLMDALAVNGDADVGLSELGERLRALDDWVVRPHIAGEQGRAECDVVVRMKRVVGKEEVEGLLERVSREGPDYVYTDELAPGTKSVHLTEGLVFVPSRRAYQPQLADLLLEWRYPSQLTVDLRVELKRNPKLPAGGVVRASYMGTSGARTEYREVHFGTRLTQAWFKEEDKWQGRIVQCCYDPVAGEWRFIGPRRDRREPSHSRHIITTLESIAQDVKQEELVAGVLGQPMPQPHEGRSLAMQASQQQEEQEWRHKLQQEQAQRRKDEEKWKQAEQELKKKLEEQNKLVGKGNEEQQRLKELVAQLQKAQREQRYYAPSRRSQVLGAVEASLAKRFKGSDGDVLALPSKFRQQREVKQEEPGAQRGLLPTPHQRPNLAHFSLEQQQQQQQHQRHPHPPSHRPHVAHGNDEDVAMEDAEGEGEGEGEGEDGMSDLGLLQPKDGRGALLGHDSFGAYFEEVALSRG